MTKQIASRRVAINTIVLYIRLLIVMIIGLITTRLVLAALGETNYGVYSLVAGVVGMLALLQGAMAGASMRFLAYGLGSNNQENQLKTFNTTLFLHFALGAILVIIIELGGIIMFKYYLNVPVESLYSAKIVFHLMVITTFISVISVPYDAVINSHENMAFLAFVDILGSILKLAIALLITYSRGNLLVIYGTLILLTQLIIRIIKQIYSQKKYSECNINFKKNIDKSLVLSILSFSGLNLIGSISSMLVSQFRSVLLNMFFGVKINASQGIAQNVSSQVNTVSVSMTQAIRPQLIKSEGRGNRSKMLSLTSVATRFSIFLFALLAIPVTIEIPYLLKTWLTIVPAFTTIFCRLLIIGLFVDKLTFEIGTAISAVGNIKSMTIAEASTIIISVIVSYVLFKLGYPPFTLYIVLICFSLITMAERLYFGNRVAGLNVLEFINCSLRPVFIPVCLSIIIGIIPSLFLCESLFRMILTFFISITIIIITFTSVGLTKSEFVQIKGMIKDGYIKTICLLKGNEST